MMTSRLELRAWLRYEALVIGASWGGVEALTTLVSELPADFPLAVVVVQHQHPHARNALASILSRASPMAVKDVDDKDEMNAGTIYLAPANYHLLLERDRTLSLSLDAPVLFCRPALDVTFASVAAAVGGRCMGLVLTGANEDGAEGIRKIKAAGGYTMAQEPSTAVAPVMPKAAIATGCVDKILRLEEIVPHMLQVLGIDQTS
jgi:two-component system chemotaxis response regulator CheB